MAISSARQRIARRRRSSNAARARARRRAASRSVCELGRSGNRCSVDLRAGLESPNRGGASRRSRSSSATAGRCCRRGWVIDATWSRRRRRRWPTVWCSACRRVTRAGARLFTSSMRRPASRSSRAAMPSRVPRNPETGLAVANGRVYFSTIDNTVYSFGIPDGTLIMRKLLRRVGVSSSSWCWSRRLTCRAAQSRRAPAPRRRTG